MRARLLALALLCTWAAGCNKPATPTTVDDGGVDPYDGPTSSVIPTFDPDSVDAATPVVDAGQVTVDQTCCPTHFSISDQEPQDAQGWLVGSHYALAAGVALSRTDAGWETSFCFPVNASSTYWYRFVFDGGFIDAGEVYLADGGTTLDVTQVQAEELRASDREPSFVDSNGDTRNYFREVSSCAGLDGGVPTP